MSYRFLICILFALVSAVVPSQAQVLRLDFEMTQMGAIMPQGGVAPMNAKASKIEVNLVAAEQVVVVGEGSYMLGKYSGLWFINELNALEIKNASGTYFTIDVNKQVINVANDGTVILFSKPKDSGTFKRNYEKLLSELRSANLLKGQSAKTANTATPTAAPKASAQEVKRPQGVPAQVDAVAVSSLRNSAHRGRPGVGLKFNRKWLTSETTMAGLFAHPLGYGFLDWKDSEERILKNLVDAGMGFECLYHNPDRQFLWTKIDLSATVELPGKICVDGKELRLGTTKGANLTLSRYNDGPMDINACMQCYINTVGAIAVPEDFDKKAGKQLEQYFESLLAQLRQCGCTVTKKEKRSYAFRHPEGLRGEIRLSLPKYNVFNDAYIWLNVFRAGE